MDTRNLPANGFHRQKNIECLDGFVVPICLVQLLDKDSIGFAKNIGVLFFHFTLSDAFSVKIVEDIIHQGEQYAGVDLDGNMLVLASTKLNFRLSLASADEWWSATVGVKNAIDQHTQNQVIGSVLLPGTYYAQRPQTPGIPIAAL